MQRLDISHLQLLVALQQHGTMTAASSAINLSTSAASRRLQEAERRLSVALVERRGRTLELTVAGRMLAETAERTERELSDAEFAARWLQAGDNTPVRVGVGFYDQLEWLLPYGTVNAGAAFEVVRSSTAAASDAAGTDVSIDVVGMPSADTGTSETVSSERVDLSVDHLVLVVSAEDPPITSAPVVAADVGACRYLASSLDPRPGFEFEKFFLPAGVGPLTIVRVESFAALLTMVANGGGVSIQPSLAVRGRAHSGVRVLELSEHIEVRWQCTTQLPENSGVRDIDSRKATADFVAMLPPE